MKGGGKGGGGRRLVGWTTTGGGGGIERLTGGNLGVGMGGDTMPPIWLNAGLPKEGGGLLEIGTLSGI